jgi:hypothetical protein
MKAAADRLRDDPVRTPDLRNAVSVVEAAFPRAEVVWGEVERPIVMADAPDRVGQFQVAAPANARAVATTICSSSGPSALRST